MQICVWAGIVVLSFGLGVLLNLPGHITWDDGIQYFISRAAIGEYGLSDLSLPQDHNGYYAILWELVLGICTEYLFAWMRDPYLVRHAVTFVLYPTGLYLVVKLLRKSGVPWATTALAVAMLVGIIRFGGHALFNTKDFPTAMAYLITTLAMWVIFRNAVRRKFPPSHLAGLGVVAALPFLLRMPLLLHVLLLVGLTWGYALFAVKMQVGARIRLAVLPLAACIIVVVCFYPKFWTLNFGQWVHAFTLFADFNPVIMTRAWGVVYDVRELPWWFSLRWIIMIANPLAFIALVGGMFLLFLRRGGEKQEGIALPFWGGTTYVLTLPRWIWIVAGLSFAAIIVQRPLLYDEERQILFLYPLVFVLGALGFQHCKEKLQWILVAAILLASAFSYSQWGRLSYVYKSPLGGDSHAQSFLGDYWGICLSAAMDKLPELAPDVVWARTALNHVSEQQQIRRLQSAIASSPSMKEYHFTNDPPAEAFVRIDLNRFNDPRQWDTDPRGPQLIWEWTMPPGEPACTMYKYPPASGSPLSE